MQVGPLEGRFLSVIAGLMDAKRVLEFGTFTGYIALSFAEALPEDGKVTTLDRDPRATEVAREFWSKSPWGGKIELILGDAHQTVELLQEEINSKRRPLFDLAFIDADKSGYPAYWNACFSLLRKGGAILVDNVLWSGRVLNPLQKSDRVIDEFNQMVLADLRAEKVLLPLRDGLFLARVK